MNPQRPNIVLINCDDLGYGDLGCYGSERNDTPHIDSLARNGLRLTDFYMGSPVCSASRAAMLTGCYPPRIGFGASPVLFPGQDIGLSTRETTIAKALQAAGYKTQIVGKWHCGDQPEFLPTRHGFDHYFGIPFSNDMGRQSNHPDRPPLPLLRDETVIQEQPDQRGVTERYADECLRFIEDNRDSPFFLYLAHMYVHVPLFVSKPFLEASRNGAYGGAVAAIDWCTGMIVERLRKCGLLENTLLIFTSDNGSRARDEGGSNAPCRGTKGTTWEGGQRVPCIFHWPAVIEPGRTYEPLARSIDLFPTLCRLAGGNEKGDLPIDGVDLSEVLTHGKSEPVAESFAYYQGEALEAVRLGDWKLHFAKNGGREVIHELYHLREDPGESENLFDEKPEIVAKIQRHADRIRQETGDNRLGMEGNVRRPAGRVEDAQPLTGYDPAYPYIIAMYDLPDMPTMSG